MGMLTDSHIGISTNILNNPLDISGAIARLATTFNHVEIALDDHALELFKLDKVHYVRKIAEIASIKKRQQCQLIVRGPYQQSMFNLAATDKLTQVKTMKLWLKTLLFAKHVNADMLVIVPGFIENVNISRFKQFKMLKYNLAIMAKRARHLNIKLCLANPRSGQMPRFVLTSSQLKECCKKFNIQFAFNILEFMPFDNLRGRYFSALRKLMPYMGLIYIGDMQITSKKPMPLGQGDFPIQDVLTFVACNGYVGNVIIHRSSIETASAEHMLCARKYKHSHMVLQGQYAII